MALDDARVLLGFPPPAAITRPSYLLPERAQQTTLSLQLPEEAAALARRLDDHVTLSAPAAVLAHPNLLGTTTTTSALDAPLVEVLQRVHESLGRLAARSAAQQRPASGATDAPVAANPKIAYRARCGSACGPVGNYDKFGDTAATTLSAAHSYADFFPPQPPVIQGAPSVDRESYGMFRASVASLLEQPQGDRPRDAQIPMLTKEALAKWRLPPLPGQRLCVFGSNCLMNVSSSQHGYVGREFWPFPVPPAVDAPLRPCVEDELYRLTIEAQTNLNQKTAPSRPIDYFNVMIGRGEYGPHAIIRRTVDGRLTGVSGAVPQYHGNMRVYQPIPRDYLELYVKQGGAASSRGVPRFMVAEANTDFRMASAGPTAASTF